MEDYLGRVVHSLGAADRAHVSVERAAGRHGSQPSALAPSHGPHFSLVTRAIQESTSLDQVVVVPFLTPGVTDSRWYADLAGGRVYRFAPLYVNASAGDMGCLHGPDERIARSHLADGVRFYARLVRLAAE